MAVLRYDNGPSERPYDHWTAATMTENFALNDNEEYVFGAAGNSFGFLNSAGDLLGCCDVRLNWKDCSIHGDANFDQQSRECKCNQATQIIDPVSGLCSDCPPGQIFDSSTNSCKLNCDKGRGKILTPTLAEGF